MHFDCSEKCFPQELILVGITLTMNNNMVINRLVPEHRSFCCFPLHVVFISVKVINSVYLFIRQLRLETGLSFPDSYRANTKIPFTPFPHRPQEQGLAQWRRMRASVGPHSDRGGEEGRVQRRMGCWSWPNFRVHEGTDGSVVPVWRISREEGKITSQKELRGMWLAETGEEKLEKPQNACGQCPTNPGALTSL